ncbi:carboxymuconolactone decarboxylase family protein [Mycobacterium sp. NBC_00419]|uniref:carboxymuconolactone decarboxylase family protein n=1 Tax=Mycobacterium sp. NBC_00419 TaxID=2975989 RepID=UPI002E1A16E0
MTTFTAVQPENATGTAADLLAQVQKALGVTPNMTKVMANSPGLLRSYLALSGAVSKGVLSGPVRERLAIATAQLNGCEYCLSAHTHFGATAAKLSAEELDSARRGRSQDAHVEALLTLSNAIAANAGDVDEADLAAARLGGVTEEEIGELVANLALNILTNYFNVLAKVDNDWPAVTL